MPKTHNVGSQSETSLAGAPDRAAEQLGRPEFYRLPKGSGGDQFFHLTRTFYYEGEKRGYWRLVRIRERGKLRGVTLVPYDAVAAFVRSQMEDAQ
jgi:hypothetical protein